MKLKDIKLMESITFSVSKIEDDPKYGKTHVPIGKFVDVPCIACDGTGKQQWHDEEPETCVMCKGTGVAKDFVSDAPELNLANRNADVLLNLLGIESDYSGTIWNKDLPELRRAIIRLLNSEDSISGAAIDRSTKHGEVRRDKIKGDDGVTHIVTRRGPTMMDFGLPPEQIKRYLKVLLDMIDFAQKGGYHLGWS